jgi:hypothetical protein
VLERDDDGTIVPKWEFETILDCHHEDGLNYLVKWKHHAPTWQPADDLRDNVDLVREWHRNHPRKPGPPAWARSNADLPHVQSSVPTPRRRSPRLSREG